VTSPGGPPPGAAHARTVEVVGPPGTGKSTLTAALAAAGERISVVQRYGDAPGVAGLLRAAAVVVPLARSERDRRRLRWMARLEASAGVLERCRGDAPVVLFDQGPVYTLARLWASAAGIPRQPGYTRWYDAKLRQWRDLLDVVVVLDAPDEVLLGRIRGRAKPHAAKGMPASSARAALGRERAAYAGVLAALGPATTLRLDGRDPVEDMVSTTLAALSVRAGR
jgi:AAA domain